MGSSFQAKACIIPVSFSDHFPMELKFSEGLPKGMGGLKFLSMWWRDGEFLSNLEWWWKESNIFRGTPSFCFVKRMKFMKEKIKRWNRDCFKNISKEKSRIEEALLQINLDTILRGMTNDMFLREKALKEELVEVLLREEIFLRHKSRELWIKEGDANKKKIHASVKTKRDRNKIETVMHQNGKFNSSFEAIEEIAINNFKILLGNDNGVKNIQSAQMVDVIQHEISDEDNKYMLRPFSKEEVRKAVFDMHPNKAPDPAGITMECFQKCWGFMGDEIFKVVEDFRK
ncbi:uncharacterized protein LOC131857828 [Cryptomeria japonica]|uniref:uncharacterized protein LOC131857828 n=1 Tax=Cryptomeria japonica TaxID=3369 RepID=UPI0027DA9168|nr:uncharacterized protein LOC131857828 [Cryptomeria japonica]